MAYLAKSVTGSLMSRKHVHVIEKRSLYSQNVFCYLRILWCVPYRREFSVFSSVGRGSLENCSDPGATVTQSCAEKYEVFYALYRIKFD